MTGEKYLGDGASETMRKLLARDGTGATQDEIAALSKANDCPPLVKACCVQVAVANTDPRRFVVDKDGVPRLVGISSEPGKAFLAICDRLDGKPMQQVTVSRVDDANIEAKENRLMALIDANPALGDMLASRRRIVQNEASRVPLNGDAAGEEDDEDEGTDF